MGQRQSLADVEDCLPVALAIDDGTDNDAYLTDDSGIEAILLEEANAVGDPSVGASSFTIDDEAPLDPRLLEDAENLHHKMQGTTDADEHMQCKALEAAIFGSTDMPEEGHIEFIDRYAKINVIHYRTTSRLSTSVLEERYSGNSRAAPSLFERSCPYPGCDFKTTKIRFLETEHMLDCPFEPSKIPPATKAVPCAEAGCKSSFDKASDMKVHFARSHRPWIARTCTRGGDECDSTHVFLTRKEFESHTKAVHVKKFEPTQCLVESCDETQIFKSYAGYRQHLGRVHLLQTEDRKQYFPHKEKMQYLPGVCPVPGCRLSTNIWKGKHNMLAHLRTRLSGHYLTEDEVQHYISLRMGVRSRS